jgi:16S rRNA (adenine1518-N6/adenine1519-N6)-dimethyltransferase
MNPTLPDVPGLLRRYGLRPDKSLGQNFLIDPPALQRVIAAAGLEEAPAPRQGHQVLEIGPGLGSLTVLLARQARQVVAVELDANLLPPLHEVLAPYDNIDLVHGDILTLDPAELVNQPGYLVVANIPYYITSALIRHLLESRLPPARLVLTVQREVALRICAAPGEMSLLALSVQVYGKPKIAAHIPAGAFFPPPRVDSAVVRVDLLPAPQIPVQLLPHFFRLAKAGFSQKRKTLRNALSGGMHWSTTQSQAILNAAAIDPQRRAETLSIVEWGRLVEQSPGSTPDQDEKPGQET